MFTLINFLKTYENKISESEQIETQYLARECYINDNFHLNSFSKIIMNKIKDSSHLISLLNKNIQEIKNEILNQINSNFNNHIILISKIQTVDFLLENIEKPLYIIKQKIQNKLELINKNENDLKLIINYLNDNEKVLQNAKISFTYFKLISQSKTIESSLQKKQDSAIIKNILENNEHTTLLASYDFLKNLLTENFRILTINQKIKILSDSLNKNLSIEQNKKILETQKNDNKEILKNAPLNDILNLNDVSALKEKIQSEDELRYSILEKILEICLDEILKNINQKKEDIIILYKTLFTCLYNCYKCQNKLIYFYEKIKISYFINEINDVFSKESKIIHNSNINLGIDKKFKIFDEILRSKFYFLFEICKENKHLFNLICIWIPILNKISLEKNIFICIDQEIFSNNFNSILYFIDKYPILDKKILLKNKISNFHFDGHLDLQLDRISKIEENIKNEYFDLENKEKNTEQDDNYYENLKLNFFNYLQNFSFFTYYQFLQNDITKIMINSVVFDKQNFTFEIEEFKKFSEDNNFSLLEKINKNFFNMSNFLFNFNKHINSLFQEKKLFLKNIPNFLNFILSCFSLISKKQAQLFKDDDENTVLAIFKVVLEKYNDLPKTITNEFTQNLCDYFKNFNNYFKTINELKKNIDKVIIRESFIIKNITDILELKEKLSRICELNDAQIINKKILISQFFITVLDSKIEIPQYIRDDFILCKDN